MDRLTVFRRIRVCNREIGGHRVSSTVLGCCRELIDQLGKRKLYILMGIGICIWNLVLYRVISRNSG